MVESFEVTAQGGDPVPEPSVDGTVVLDDYFFELPPMIGRDDVLAVTNASGSEVHEMVVVQPDEGVAAADVAGALDDRAPLPGVAVGGMQAILPGTRAFLRLDLEPGRFVVFCAVTSPDGTAHHAAGMVQEVEVV